MTAEALPREISTLYVWVRGLTMNKPKKHALVIGQQDLTACGIDVGTAHGGWAIAAPEHLAPSVRTCRSCWPDSTTPNPNPDLARSLA